MSSKEKKHIAFIYEGEKTEKALIEKLQEVYFSNIAQTTVISFPAEGNIYMLWKRLKESEFETEVIEEIKEMSNEINYKNYVSEQIEFQNFKKINKEKWEIACRASLKRANLIVNYKEEFPTYEQFLRELGQNDIFKAQLEKFVFSNKMVAVLNSVPLFLLEYFDKEFWNQVVM